MAANSQDDPHPQGGSSYHNHNNSINAINFHSGAVNTSNTNTNTDIIQMGCYNSNNSTSCSSGLLLDTVTGLKHDDALAVDWTQHEQFNLEQALLKYKDQPSTMKYIKIASMLHDKTVRDVALRCRWMTRKRRKQEESPLERKGNHRKDKPGESFSKANIPSASIPTSVGYSFPMNQMEQSQRVKCEALSSKAKHLLELNMQAFTQININLSFLKLQDNIDHFCRARDNINSISAILNDLRGVSVKINQMQDLPISIEQNLANSILPHTTL